MNKHDSQDKQFLQDKIQHHKIIFFLPQNHMSTHQPNQTHNEIPLPCYLQQHEITKTYLTNFSQIPNTAKSLQMTTNSYLMVGSSISSNKPLMVSTGTDPVYSLETI